MKAFRRYDLNQRIYLKFLKSLKLEKFSGELGLTQFFLDLVLYLEYLDQYFKSVVCLTSDLHKTHSK